MRIKSSAPSFFADSGDVGLPVTHGSNRIFLPPGDCSRKVAWPSQVIARDIGVEDTSTCHSWRAGSRSRPTNRDTNKKQLPPIPPLPLRAHVLEIDRLLVDPPPWRGDVV